MTGVITALPLEARTARAFAAIGWRVTACGVGQQRAYAAACRLCEQGVQRLLVWGVAGALDTQLAPGDVLVPDRILDVEGVCWPVDAQWQTQLLAAVATATTVNTGALVTVDTAVTSPQAKTRLGHDTGAVGVDMESAAVARCAHAQGLPFAVVRAVVDPAQQALPQAVLQAQDRHYPTLAVAGRLATHPREVAQVMALARCMRTARRSLAELAARLAASVSVTGAD